VRRFDIRHVNSFVTWAPRLALASYVGVLTVALPAAVIAPVSREELDIRHVKCFVDRVFKLALASYIAVLIDARPTTWLASVSFVISSRRASLAPVSSGSVPRRPTRTLPLYSTLW
jgi:hypothetical protein